MFNSDIKSYDDAAHYFQNIGAVSFYDSKSRDGTLIHRHFFNKDGNELGYASPDMVELVGVFVFETPRVWGEKPSRIRSIENLVG